MSHVDEGTTKEQDAAPTGTAVAAATAVPFMDRLDTSQFDALSTDERMKLMDEFVASTAPEEIEAQKRQHDAQIADMQAFVGKAKEDGIVGGSDDEADNEAAASTADGSMVVNPSDMLKKIAESGADTARLEQARAFQERMASTRQPPQAGDDASHMETESSAPPQEAGAKTSAQTNIVCPNAAGNAHHECTQYCADRYGQDLEAAARLRPQLPPDAALPTEPTLEQYEADPENPKFDPIPEKRRVNRYTLDPVTKQPLVQLPEGVAGLAADGTEIPIDNSGPHFNPRIPDSMGDREHRNWLLKAEYDAQHDRNAIWNPKTKYMVVSVVGPRNCNVKTDNFAVRVWGFAKTQAQCKTIAEWAKKCTPYGRIFDMLSVEAGGWFSVPPQFASDATATYSNAAHQKIMEEYLTEQKRAVVELEQRAMDTAAEANSKGNTMAEQLRRQAAERRKAAREQRKKRQEIASGGDQQ